MARIPEYPPILNGSTELQIAQIREFLMRLVRDLADAGIYDESTGAAEIEAVDQKIDDLADSLADVATSGSYNDLTDRPPSPVNTTNALSRVIESLQTLASTITSSFTHTGTIYTLAFDALPFEGGYVSTPVILGQSGIDYTVTAIPASGYRFRNWTSNGSIVSTSAAERWTANGNRIITANFEQI